MATLYLIPNLLGDTLWQNVLPGYLPEVISGLKHFIVEDTRNARRFLKRIDSTIRIDELQFYELNKHTGETGKGQLTELLKQGMDFGLISEAGCPGVADPGAEIVLAAHRLKIKVVPLVGPSSVLLALMASGLNGQHFTFNGYLPVKQPERIRKIEQLEKTARIQRQSQIFIETPYRNNAIFQDLIRNCQPDTWLCIAADLTSAGEWISTMNISEWRKNIPDLNKIPAIYIIGF